MSENLFKNHSVNDIQACIAKALTELVGEEVQVGISQLKVSSDTLGLSHIAVFDVSASHKQEWVPGEMSF